MAKQIFGTSPPVARKQYLSRSLDIAENRMAAAAQAQNSAQRRDDAEKKAKAQEETKCATNVVKFEAKADYVFKGASWRACAVCSWC